jgi:uncharacterized protein
MHETLKNIFSNEDEIEAAYLFGSQADGTSTATSDLDVAIKSKSKDYFAKNKLRLLSILVKAGFEKVDLVELDIKDLSLCFHVLKYNYPIYLAKNFNHPEYYSKIIRMYFHFKHILDIKNARIKQKLMR